MNSTFAASQINDPESLHPNPNNGIFTLSLTNGFSDEAVTVFDISSRKVYQQKFNTKQKQVDLELKMISNELYIVKVHNGITGVNFTERLIINIQ